MKHDKKKDSDKDRVPSDWTIDGGRHQLLKRCQDLNFHFELIEIGLLGERTNTLLSLSFPNGNGTRRVFAFTDEAAHVLLSNQFHEYEFLGHFSAIYSKTFDVIEAHVTSAAISHTQILAQLTGGKLISNPLSLAIPTPGSQTEDTHLTLKASMDDEFGTRIILGLQSPISAGLLSSSFVNPGQISIRVEGVSASLIGDPLNFLKRVSDALFFDIDLNHNIALNLSRTRYPVTPRLSLPKPPRNRPQFPQMEYHNEPMSLYLYGRTAYEMPLLQYLSFYQVMEYYFPIYSRRDMTRIFQESLKDPRFRLDDEAAIAKVLSQLSLGVRNSLGGERNQLHATLAGSVQKDELVAFLCSSEESKKFFSTKHKALSDSRINLDSRNTDVVTETSNVIYDIRCKIVHTKVGEPDSDGRLLLPDSPETDTITGFVELIRFLAQKVLICNARVTPT
jgi:hypothetical protein